MFSVGKSKAVRATKVTTRFKDVAGLDEAKVEIVATHMAITLRAVTP